MEVALLWFIAVNMSLQFFHNAYMHGKTEKELWRIERKLDIPITE